MMPPPGRTQAVFGRKANGQARAARRTVFAKVDESRSIVSPCAHNHADRERQRVFANDLFDTHAVCDYSEEVLKINGAWSFLPGRKLAGIRSTRFHKITIRRRRGLAVAKILRGRIAGIHGMESQTAEELHAWAERFEHYARYPDSPEDPGWLGRWAKRLRCLAEQ